MTTLKPVGSAYRTTYEAVNDVLGTTYDGQHHPQGGLFVPQGFNNTESVWFARLYEDDHLWINQKMSTGEMWESNGDNSVLDENDKWQDPSIERATFTQSSPGADWVFCGVYKAKGFVFDTNGRRWRAYVPV